MLELLLTHKRLALEIIGCALIGAIAWWAFIHNPRIIREQAAQLAAMQQQVNAARSALTMMDNINKEKGRIDNEYQAAINHLKSVVFANHSTGVFMPGGRLSTSGLPGTSGVTAGK